MVKWVSVLVLAFLDFYLADWLGIQGTTVLRALEALLGKRALFICVLLAGVVTGVALWLAWFTEDPDWIDYPPLYKEIKEQREEQQKLFEEQRKLFEEQRKLFEQREEQRKFYEK